MGLRLEHPLIPQRCPLCVVSQVGTQRHHYIISHRSCIHILHQLCVVVTQADPMHHYLLVGRLELQVEHVECAGVDVEAAVILHNYIASLAAAVTVRAVGAVVTSSLQWPTSHHVLYVGPHYRPGVAPALVDPADVLSQHLTITHKQADSTDG